LKDVVTTRIDPVLKAKLEDTCKKLGISPSEAIRRLILNFIKVSSNNEALQDQLIFSSSPLLTLAEYLSLTDVERANLWEHWFKEELDRTLAETPERDV